jgi:hypothetical protein
VQSPSTQNLICDLHLFQTFHTKMQSPEIQSSIGELSYDEEQIHIYMMNRFKEEKERVGRERVAREQRDRSSLREEQDKAYQESESQDKFKNSLEFEEVSQEEMRKIRLLRFQR